MPSSNHSKQVNNLCEKNQEPYINYVYCFEQYLSTQLEMSTVPVFLLTSLDFVRSTRGL